ncbi:MULTISPECIES: DMT family transporter [Pseudophaeobacter]|jgi:drug/metabolite transporter (DMT)-like permease|uniref:DMT family transporter n=1 Tax=Pseudophaeobacter TaxID=1541822 RepID=UPI0024323472|nr:DMT family transporter [Pseudophaeobacter profundi]
MLSSNQRGAFLMMGAMAGFTVNDALVKSVGSGLPLSQILVLRGLMASALIFALARYYGSLRLRLSRRDWGLVALRCLSEAGATFLFLTALMLMPLANITAVLQMLPLTVTLGAALLFKETVGWRRMLAILAGFCGMLLIVRPGPEGFDLASIYALGAVACVTLRDLSTRRMSENVPSLTVTLMASLSVLTFGCVYSFWQDWTPVAPVQLGMLAAAACFILLGYLCSVMTMRVGDVAVVSPFRYTGLLWALILGWLVFGDWPAPLTLLGAALVVGAGLFTLYREHRLARRQATAGRRS